MQNTLEPVWAFDQSMNDFRVFSSEQEWVSHIDVPGAVLYLEKHFKKSLEDDFYPAYKTYKRRGVGFFALPRIVFPYITFLGTLLGGEDSTKNAVEYMNNYLSKVNRIYSEDKLCDFIYSVYRHGLAHTYLPKVVADNGNIYGWKITFDDNQHLSVDKDPGIRGKDVILSISPNKLTSEVLSSVDEYIKALRSNPVLFENFKKGFLSMSTTSHYKDKKKTKRIVAPDYLSR